MQALRIISTISAISAMVLATAAVAQETEHRLGDHPAVVVKRLAPQQGYDYAAKFYPHPAWLYLSSEAPRPMMQHPAVIVFERERQRLADEAAARTSGQDIVAVHRR